jgi:hypothetical protein
MTSDNTTSGTEDREGQDHETEEIPTLAEIRFHRVMRLILGLAVWPVGIWGMVRVAESGGDLAEVATAIVATATVALFCAFAGVQASQLQTARDEAEAAVASGDHDAAPAA